MQTAQRLWVSDLVAPFNRWAQPGKHILEEPAEKGPEWAESLLPQGHMIHFNMCFLLSHSISPARHMPCLASEFKCNS